MTGFRPFFIGATVLAILTMIMWMGVYLFQWPIGVAAISAYLPIHAFGVGGIGIITLCMMARVTLGHTGRDIHQAPPIMTPLLSAMILAAGIRIFFPLLDPGHYRLWITVSATLWIISYALFARCFIPFLLKPRADGKPG